MEYERSIPLFWKGVIDPIIIPVWMVFTSMIGCVSMAQDTSFSLKMTIGATVGIWGLTGQFTMVELIAVGLPGLSTVIAS